MIQVYLSILLLKLNVFCCALCPMRLGGAMSGHGLWEQRREAHGRVSVDWLPASLGAPCLFCPPSLALTPPLAQPLDSLVASTCEIPPVVLTHTVSPSWKHPGSPSPIRPQPCSGGPLLGHSWDPTAPHGGSQRLLQDSILISYPDARGLHGHTFLPSWLPLCLLCPSHLPAFP